MSVQRTKQSPYLLLVGLIFSVAAGCGGENYTFYGEGQFDVARGAPPAFAPALFTSEVTLRHAGRGTSELILSPTCSVRMRAGRIIGTQRCEIATASSSVQLNFQDGTWGVTESFSGTSSDGCDRWRYDILVDATGSVRATSQAAHFTFSGVREDTVCASSSGVDGGVFIWDEGADYPGDVYDDWESDGGYDDDGAYDDGDYDDGYDDDYDDGDYDDGDYDDGDYDDGGGDDGGGDDGGWDDGGWLRARSVSPRVK